MSANRDGGLLSTAAASKYKTAGRNLDEDDKSEDDPDE
jgi:hypothetical protein